jgi:hypothetical protein
MVMKNARDLFAQTDQQVSVLKKRIAQQCEAIKQAKLTGHSTAAHETIQHSLHQTLRAFEKRRQQIFERMEAMEARDKNRTCRSLFRLRATSGFIGTHNNVCSSQSVRDARCSRGLNRQSCDRDYNSRKEPADAKEHQNIVDFGHSFPP